ncbi:hypothetical protein PanWU01x14_247510 [Parasponia andersonii]|uniref:Uncharacterized protein n=1 Tax=Parasponia andersonii TaxID=3476 RepID=A0A2P5BE28_PARAD|nr:hypothetical protein PanWU01x14_247510 [Parasponia andersonii]
MINGFNEENSYCYFHPREIVIGVCPLCLNERLVVLASSQGRRSYSSARGSSSSNTSSYHKRAQHHQNKKATNNFQKIFDFSSFLHRLEFRPWKSDLYEDDHDVSTSQEDSFISIKFEENGAGSWEKNKNNNTVVSKVSLENCNMSWNHSFGNKEQQQAKETKTVIEHGKSHASSLRWRKRIGHLFQLTRWKRSNKGTVCNVSSKAEGVKVRKGWIRILTKKRTME